MSGEKVMKAMPVGIEEMLVCFADAVKDVLGNINGALMRDNSKFPEKIRIMKELSKDQKDFFTLIGMSVVTLPRELLDKQNMETLADAVIERLEKLDKTPVDFPQDPEEQEYVRPEVDKPDVMYG